MAETSRVSKNEASPETFRSCAGAAVQLCGARLQRIWVLGAYCTQTCTVVHA